MTVGTVTRLDLSNDARRIEARVVVQARYAPLIRTNTRFWSTSGLGVEIGFSGLRADLESLETLVAGGIGLATPDAPGPPADAGDRYPLFDHAEDEWLEWSPSIPIPD